MTVQSRACTVSQHYRCDADPAGTQRSAIFDQDGLTHLATIDSETRWIRSEDPETGVVDLLEPGGTDEASLSALIATGRDDFDFWTIASTGERLHHVGHDVLTGQTVTIDGVDLDQTRFTLTTSDAQGNMLWTRSGGQFISRAQRRFYGGAETGKDWTGAVETSDDTPVSFSRPGEAGFGATSPQFGCNLLTASLSQGARS